MLMHGTKTARYKFSQTERNWSATKRKAFDIRNKVLGSLINAYKQNHSACSRTISHSYILTSNTLIKRNNSDGKKKLACTNSKYIT